MTVKDFLTSLGGIVAVAKALEAPVSTVSGWAISNRIPRWRHPAIRALCDQQGIAFPDRFTSEAA